MFQLLSTKDSSKVQLHVQNAEAQAELLQARQAEVNSFKRVLYGKSNLSWRKDSTDHRRKKLLATAIDEYAE